MKKLLMLLICVSTYAQEQSFKLLNIDNGVRDPFNFLELKQQGNFLDLYIVKDNVRDVLPSLRIEETANEFFIFNMNEGVKDILPSQVIVKEPTTSTPRPVIPNSGFDARQTAKNLQHLFPNSLITF